MGLDRYFSISIADKQSQAIYNPDLADRIKDAIEKRYGGWDGSLDDYGSLTLDGVNWYDVDEDMISVSKEFPDVVFTVYCDGMGDDDKWMCGYCDGRPSFSAMTFEPMDMHWLIDGVPGNPRCVELSHEEIDLIAEALACLYEAREGEMKWADAALRASDQVILDRIDALHEKLNGE